MNNNNTQAVADQMYLGAGVQDNLKRKMYFDLEGYEHKKVKLQPSFFLDIPSGSKPIPTPETMGIFTPMDPDYLRLPKDFKLGNLAREKYAGIVMADLYDRYEIQIYCRLFEHFSHYPIYMFEEDLIIPAHVHAFSEVVRFRTPPSVLMAQARLCRTP